MRSAAHVVRRRLWPLLAVTVVGFASPAWAACPTGQVACGTGYCMLARQTCCDSVGHPEKYCAAGKTCSADGLSCIGTALGCAPAYSAAISNCGTEDCTCQPACTTGSTCSTGCCAPNGYCAPNCVCNSSGTLVLNCGATSFDGGVKDGGVDGSVWPDAGGKDGGTKPSGPTLDPFGTGCSVGGSGMAGAGPLMALLIVVGWWRRRGRR